MQQQNQTDHRRYRTNSRKVYPDSSLVEILRSNQQLVEETDPEGSLSIHINQNVQLLPYLDVQRLPVLTTFD